MTSMPATAQQCQRRPATRPGRVVFAGVDTYKELHVAAVIDTGETVLGTRSSSTTRAGYRTMLAWIGELGELARAVSRRGGSMSTVKLWYLDMKIGLCLMRV